MHPDPPATNEPSASTTENAQPASEPSVAEQKRDRCVGQIRARSRWYIYQATADIFIIIALLVWIPSMLSVLDRVTRLEEEIILLKEGTETTTQQTNELDAALDKTVTASSVLRRKVESLNIESKNKDPSAVVNDLQGAFVQFTDAVFAAQSARSGFKPIAQAHETALIIQQVSAWIARFIVLACGIFLIQIMVSRYRFNSRLASQYDAMADALELSSDGAALSFEKLIVALTPNLDFGPAPRFAMQELANLVVQAQTSMKK